MFESLKKKLSGWFKKENAEEVQEESEKKEEKAESVEELKKKVGEIEKDLKGVKSRKKKSSEKKSEEKEEKKKEGAEKKERRIEEVEEGEVVAGIDEAREVAEEIEEKSRKKSDEVRELLADSRSASSARTSEDSLRESARTEGSKEELKEEFEEKKEEGFFASLKRKLSTSVLTKEDFEECFMELELTLLENNVALEVVDKIRSELEKDLVGVSVKRSEIDKTILESLKSAISGVLIEGEDILKKIEKSLEPFVILFVGINGSGKTTSVAKFASLLKSRGISCVLGAADTFRAASIEQLEKHAGKIGVPIVKSEYGKDPASVAFDAIQYAKKNKLKAVLIDSAGRMYTQGNLMREMEKIVRVAKPDMKIFVGESITGNDATEQARSFNESVGIDGVILSKADVDDKAGTILSVGYVTGKPILFLGTGQNYGDLKEFRKEDVLKGLGLG